MPEPPCSHELIENHGVIGNMRSAALISIHGTVDFFCFPSFDSPTVFAALLDDQKGGSFSIEPEMEGVRLKQLYLPDTNILLTRFLSDEGVAEITDFMPVVPEPVDGETDAAYARQIIRSVRVIKGEVRFRMRCAPRFDYARASHSVRREERSICFDPQTEAVGSMSLHSTVPMDIDGQDAVAEWVLKSGETASFAFGSVTKDELGPSDLLDPKSVQRVFQATIEYWRGWVGKATYKGRWREVVIRSALALKLLTSQEHGATIAAITFGLPEQIGGERNWDYRFSWLRDSAFTLYAMIRLGLSGEVKAYAQWMRARTSTLLADELTEAGPLRVLYRANGSLDLAEEELDHLSGYKGSRPVRIGNAAQDQLQLDIYGEILDAIYLANKYAFATPKDGWLRVIRIMEWLTANWKRPDEGIWEVRGGRKHRLHSRLMCWVAFDRAIRLTEKRSFDAPVTEWLQTRREIDADILENFWNEELQSFVHAQGETKVDGAMLLMPMLRYISPVDPRWLSTLKRIEETLAEDSLVFRYRLEDDGLDGTEGSFSACSFWFVECLARAGEVDKARLLFDKMLGYANHLGLYSEQLGSSGEHLGNFPQALTHLALISAATYLDRALNGTKDIWA